MQDDLGASPDDWIALPDAPVTPGRILVVDDEVDAGENCAFALSKVGKHDVRITQSPTKAREIARSWRPDAIVLDIEMREMDGYTLADLLIADEIKADLLFVTRLNNTSARVRGLRITEHYIAKPFHSVILLETVNAIMRRRRRDQPSNGASLDAGDGRLILDLTTRSVTNPPRPPVRLSPKEWEALALLVAAGGEVVSTGRLLKEIWNGGVGGEGLVHVTISRLRKRIERDATRPELIITEDHGYSYNIHHARG